MDMPRRPIGRPASTSSERLGVYLPTELKQRVAIAALRRGVTISDLIVEAVREYLRPKLTDAEKEKFQAFMKERRRKVKEERDRKAKDPAPEHPAPTPGQEQPDQLPLDEPEPSK